MTASEDVPPSVPGTPLQPLAATSLTQLAPALHALDPRTQAVLERCFEKLRGRDSKIDVNELKCGFELQTVWLAERILHALDTDGDGLIDREDFLTSLHTMLHGSSSERLALAFRIHDLDGDGLLDETEIQRMIELCLREDALETQPEAARHLTELLLQGVDLDHNGRISFGEFQSAIQAQPRVLEQIAHSGWTWIAPDGPALGEVSERGSMLARFQVRARPLLHALDNHAFVIALVFALGLLHLWLFERAMATYAAAGAALPMQLARGAGVCLKLGCALLLVPVMRGALTWLRRVRHLGRMPIDHAPALHRLLGHAVVVFALAHSAAHLWRVHAEWRDPFAAVANMPDGISGALLLGLLGLMWVGAMKWLRRSHFELFYHSHRAYLLFFPLLLWHAPKFLAWGALPLLAYALDHWLRRSRRTHDTHVVSASALRSSVTRIELVRPAGFVSHPTDYVLIRVPELTAHEWHPFTISSAPHQPHIALHIRKNGNWTTRLHALIAAGRTQRSPALQVELDGPYGAPCTHIFSTRFAVLIGAGIGATPFASVLESLIAPDRSSALGTPPSIPEKLHFFWINRDARGFEWFRDLLGRIEQADAGRRIAIRVFMTRGRRDAAAALVNLAREYDHARGTPDLVTGLKARTSMGPPDLLAELRAIQAEHHPHAVSVFYCGPPGLARKVRAACAKLGLDFWQEQF